jgi:hypothetical protein
MRKPPLNPQRLLLWMVLLAVTALTLMQHGLAQAADSIRLPPPMILLYDIQGKVKGFSYTAEGQIHWQHHDNHYTAQLEIRHFLLGARTQTSSGRITPRGLEPLRFADKVRTEVFAQLDHPHKLVTFSAGGTPTALEKGAQDQLSVFFQLSAQLAGAPQRFQAGDRFAFQAIGARSAEHWTFEIGSTDTLELPGGTLQAVKLKRILLDPQATQVELWLAPAMHFLPVRIRLSQAHGDFVEQQWRANQKP